jgi:histidyl-tRNA synthetase
MQQSDHNHKIETGIHVYLITDSENSFATGLKTAHYLRSKVPGLRLVLHCGGGSLKSQFKKADKSGAHYAVIIGEHEMKTRSLSLKHLREDIPQQALYQDELAEYLKLKILKK